MTLRELRELIAKSDNQDFLNSLKILISYPHLKFSTELIGLNNIYNFVLEQVKGWNDIELKNSSLRPSKQHFETLKNQIIGIAQFLNIDQQSYFKQQWQNIKNTLEKSTIENESIFLYQLPETKFLIDLFNENPNYNTGAKNYLSEQKINTIQEKDYLNGLLRAYEFKNQDTSEILQRRNQEKKSLSKIRTLFQDHLNEAESHLNDYLKRTQDNLIENFETIEELKKEKNKIFDNWFELTNKDYEVFFSNAKKSITNNEELYREKLRLEAPAEYWKKRGLKLKTEARHFLICLIVLIFLSAVGLFILLFQIPEGMLLKVFDDKVTAIKWSIILITMLSLLAYGIKILARLTFSAYHLSRDSEEREQLTHFYLALKQDSSIKDADRQLILQSLFSRADSGLLKEDSSPTMPNAIVDKYVNK